MARRIAGKSDTSPSIDAAEVGRFDALAATWWDADGPMRPLHQMNPLRLGYIRDTVMAARRHSGPLTLAGVTALDVGCGGGLVCEPLTRLGADVMGIDASPAAIEVATAHAAQMRLRIDYRVITVEDIAESGARFDLVTALEIIEHVPDPARFVAACAACLKPGGVLVVSTLNRTLRAFAFAIVGAEYVLRWLPRGTHDWNRFITPAELKAKLRASGLRRMDTAGMVYDPLQDAFRLSGDTAINYIMSARAA